MDGSSFNTSVEDQSTQSTQNTINGASIMSGSSQDEQISSNEGQPPFIQTKGQTFSLPELILSSMKMTHLVPVIAEAIKPSIEEAVQEAFSFLTDIIKNQ